MTLIYSLAREQIISFPPQVNDTYKYIFPAFSLFIYLFFVVCLLDDLTRSTILRESAVVHNGKKVPMQCILLTSCRAL